MHRDQRQSEGLPLAGVRVADFSWVVAGPYSTQMLAAMGAEVIKIESARIADRAAERGTFNMAANRHGSFHHLNNSKLSATLNLTQPRARELARELVLKSDVVIENFSHGVMARMGLDYDELARLKPELILVSSTGLGNTGPDREYTAYGMPLQSFAGMTGLTGYEDGPPGWNWAAWADPMTGRHTAFAILAALYHRNRTGEGQFIDVAMSEVVITMTPESILDYTMNGRVRGPQGNRDDAMAPHGCYPTDEPDSWIALAVEDDEQWLTLCDLMGRPDLGEDPRFAHVDQRQQHRAELDDAIAGWTQTQRRDPLFGLLQGAGIAAGPSYPFDETVNDPQITSRGLFFDLVCADGETVQQAPRVPWLVTPGPATDYRPTPAIGEDNEYVFRNVLGLSDEEIARLVEERVIY